LGRAARPAAGAAPLWDAAPDVVAVRPPPGAVDVPRGAALDGTLQVTFSEPVTLTGPALELVCERSQVHALTAAGAGAVYSFTSGQPFLPGEECWASVRPDYVSDADDVDPPDSPQSTYTWSFRVTDVPVVINELDAISPDGAADFIELYDGGFGDTALARLTLVLYRGDEAVVYLAVSLDGYRTDDEGYFVIGSAAVAGVDLLLAKGTILNGPDAVAVYAAPEHDFPNNQPVTTENLIDAVVYGPASPALLALLLPGQSPVDENSRGAANFDSNQRCPDGSGAPRATGTFIQNYPTPGGPNRCIFDEPPAVSAVSPAPNETGVPIDATIEITFNEPVNLQDQPIEIGCATGAILSYTVDGFADSYTFKPVTPLAPGVSCTVTLFPERISDADNNDPPDHLIQYSAWSFSTDSAPALVTMTPPDGATDVSIKTDVVIEFTEPVAIQDSWAQISCDSSGQHTYQTTGGPVLFALQSSEPLEYAEKCTLIISANKVNDLDDNDPPDAPLGDRTWSFTTINKPSDFVLINEIDPDTPSNDTAEFIELYDGGVGSTSLDQLALVLFNGSTNLSYEVIDLDGLKTDEQGFFVVGNAAVNPDLNFQNDALQNGPDAVALYIADATDFPTNSPLTLDGLVDAVVYGGEETSPELLKLLVDGQAALDENGRAGAAEHSLQRCPNGSGGARRTEAFIPNRPTPGEMSDCVIDNAPRITAVAPTPGATAVSVYATLALSFSEPVTLTPDAVELVCSSGEQQLILSGGPEAFHLTPLAPLPHSELCTVRVVAARVADNDPLDPPDNPESDYDWSFTTIGPPAGGVMINEVDANTTGSDAAEFIELFDGGRGHTSLDGLVVILWNGQDDQSVLSLDLNGRQTNADGYLLLGNPGLAGVDLTFPNGALQNGPDAVGLYAANPDGFPTGTPLTTAGLIDAIVYGPTDSPDGELMALLAPGQPQVDEDGRGDAAAHSNQRCPNGAGGPKITNSYKQNTPTPGSENDCITDVAPALSSMTPAPDTSGVRIDTDVVIDLTEPVAVQGQWAQISCSLSGQHTFQTNGGPTLFTLHLTTALEYAETCTIAITAKNISDLDDDDPPDAMSQDVSWAFTTTEKPADFVIINEIDPDTPSTDTAEFIELYDGGVGFTPLDNLALVLFNGSVNLSYRSIDLDGMKTNAQGYFVVGNAAVEPGLTLPDGALQNGPDAIALYIADASDFSTGSPIRFNGLIDAVVYGDAQDVTPELLALLIDGQLAVDENGRGATTQHSLQRCPNGSGGARKTASFLANNPTPGDKNFCTVDQSPEVISVSPGNGATNVSVSTVLTLFFNEAVTLAPDAIEFGCGAGGARKYTISGGPLVYQIDPQEPLPYHNLCSVRVIATKVTDQDALDPPDSPTGDYEWSFTTIRPPAVDVLINEVDAATPGSDTAEFIELFDGGKGHTSLDGLVIVFWNGQDDRAYRALDLNGRQTDDGGYFLLGNPGLPGVDLNFPNGLLQNGPDAIGLYSGNVDGFSTGVSITTVGLIDALVYGPAGAPDAELKVLLATGQPQVDEDSRDDAAAHSNQRCPNGVGGARNTAGYKQNTPTPGAANACVLDELPAVVEVSPPKGSVVAIETDLIVTFNEDVLLDEGWYEISCDTSGEHPATVSGGPTTFTLAPATLFSHDEACSVKLAAGAIHDADLDDPPDNLTADYAWEFRTVPADPPPVAGFTSNSPLWAGETAVFTNTSAGPGPLSFTWDFGDDGLPSTDTNPTHLYPDIGVYTVTLTATMGTTADAHSDIVEVRPRAVYLPAIMGESRQVTGAGGSIRGSDEALARALPALTLAAAGLQLGLAFLPARFHLALALQPGVFALLLPLQSRLFTPLLASHPDFLALALVAQLHLLALFGMAGQHLRPLIFVVGGRRLAPGERQSTAWVAALSRASPAGQVLNQNILDRLQQRVVVARGGIARLLGQNVAQRAQHGIDHVVGIGVVQHMNLLFQLRKCSI
jgi:hypothetical protein